MLFVPDIAHELRNCAGRAENLHERAKELLKVTEYELVHDSASANSVYQLRYDAYHNAGATRPREDERLWDAHDEDLHAASIALRYKGRLCASIRLHVVTHSSQSSPAVDAFPEQLKPLLASGTRLVDANCFCVDPALSGRVPELAYLMLRLPFITADLHARTKITATVTAQHKPFYMRILRCDEIAPPRPYPGRTRPLGLTLCDVGRERVNIVKRNPSFEPLPGEAHRIGLDRIGMPVSMFETRAAA